MNEPNFGDASNFVYEIPIDATTAKITLRKKDVIASLELSVGKVISHKEGNDIWKNFKYSDAWYRMFPRYAIPYGYYYTDDNEVYETVFKKRVETAIQETVNTVFSEEWENIFKTPLINAKQSLHSHTKVPKVTITLKNISQHTQQEIQEDNLKNKLEVFPNETKERSIQTWTNYYIKTHIHISESHIPNGKTKAGLIKHINSYLTEE
jgi:hypothetical protein